MGLVFIDITMACDQSFYWFFFYLKQRKSRRIRPISSFYTIKSWFGSSIKHLNVQKKSSKLLLRFLFVLVWNMQKKFLAAIKFKNFFYKSYFFLKRVLGCQLWDPMIDKKKEVVVQNLRYAHRYSTFTASENFINVT